MEIVFNTSFKITIVAPSMRSFFKKSAWNNVLDMDDLTSLPSMFSSNNSPSSSSMQKTSASSMSTDLQSERYNEGKNKTKRVVVDLDNLTLKKKIGSAVINIIGKPPLGSNSGGKLQTSINSVGKSSIRKDSNDELSKKGRGRAFLGRKTFPVNSQHQ